MKISPRWKERTIQNIRWWLSLPLLVIALAVLGSLWIAATLLGWVEQVARAVLVHSTPARVDRFLAWVRAGERRTKI